MLVLTLYGAMLILMLTRVAAPIGGRPTGRVRREVSLGWRERLLLQRTNIYLLGTAVLLGGIGGWLSAPLAFAVVLGAWAIVALPARYILTDDGIGLNGVVFRRWSEFHAVEDARHGLRLVGREGQRDFPLVVAPNHRAAVRGELVRALTHPAGPVRRERRTAA